MKRFEVYRKRSRREPERYICRKACQKQNVVTLDGNLRIAASIFFHLFKSLIIILHLCTVIIHLGKKI